MQAQVGIAVEHWKAELRLKAGIAVECWKVESQLKVAITVERWKTESRLKVEIGVRRWKRRLLLEAKITNHGWKLNVTIAVENFPCKFRKARVKPIIALETWVKSPIHSLWVHDVHDMSSICLPTSPYSIFVSTKPIFETNCANWQHAAKVRWHQNASSVAKGLTAYINVHC